MSRLWDKGKGTDDLVLRYTVGDDHLLDARLVPFDVRASTAHARMLAQQGYLKSDEAELLATTLAALADDHAAGKWSISMQEEDVHTALEGRLTERLGELGKKIHLGRSRNDQVLVALRLYLREVCDELDQAARRVVEELSALSLRHHGMPLPGYTHQQRAMPSSVSAWASAWASEILDDAAALQGVRRRLGRNPLGSAAGYGTPGVNLDREATTEALGFDEVHEPVTAVQVSRGKAEAELIFQMTLLMQDLGRLASDLCLFATAEFGFVKLPFAFTTGSSIMPQKRNPDVFELVRARSAQLPGDLHQVLALTAKMTSGYHRDLQLVKPPLFRSIDSTLETLEVMAHALPELSFDESRVTEAMDPELDATEEAYRLVTEEGMSFRDAYRTVAERLDQR